jgi:hypothetical protein
MLFLCGAGKKFEKLRRITFCAEEGAGNNRTKAATKANRPT